nr:facilitated trehalose transporter Tret1 [Helicoverpa armigera]
MCGGDLYFWRQAFILTTGLFYSASVGIMLANPSVLSPALVSSNGTDIKASSEQASWIAASNGFAGMFGFFILSPILQTFGRKVVHISCNLLLLIGWMIFPLANSIPLLYAARIVQGLAIGGIYINSMIICEYVDYKRRGYFLTLKKVSIAVGTLICHSMSLYWNWRQIATFGIIPPSIAVILTFFWPESPSFLAMKGRFEECEESFIWLNGRSNLKELHHLQLTQMETVKHGHSEKHYKFLFRKEFIKPLYKGIGSCISGVVFTLLYTLTLKLTPLLIDSIGVGGTYGVYGFSVCGCLVLLYFVVPETKDKTLQQIEDGIKGVKRTKCEFETNALL